MYIKRNANEKSLKGPAEYFSGNVWIDNMFEGTNGSRLKGATVAFEPNARSAWHTHPLGQVLIVIYGMGRIQKFGEEIKEIYPGDIVWIAPNEKHWHGAAENNPMIHIAIVEEVEGEFAEWMEHVEDK